MHINLYWFMKADEHFAMLDDEARHAIVDVPAIGCIWYLFAICSSHSEFELIQVSKLRFGLTRYDVPHFNVVFVSDVCNLQHIEYYCFGTFMCLSARTVRTYALDNVSRFLLKMESKALRSYCYSFETFQVSASVHYARIFTPETDSLRTPNCMNALLWCMPVSYFVSRAVVYSTHSKALHSWRSSSTTHSLRMIWM